MTTKQSDAFSDCRGDLFDRLCRRRLPSSPQRTDGRLIPTRTRRSASSALLGVVLASALTACATSAPSTERAACLNYESSREVNESSSIVLLLVGVTNPEAFRSATPRELLSDSPPGTEGESRSIVVTPGESGSEQVMIERLSKRLGVIADYRNRTGSSKIAVDLPIRCYWPKPSVNLMRDTIDD